MALGEKKSRATRTTKQVLEDQEAERARVNREAIEEMDKAQQENQEKAIHSDNVDINEMIIRAKQFGAKLDSDAGFQADAQEIIQAQEVTDYKVIAMLKHIDTALSANERMLLPWPGITRADGESAKAKVGANGSKWGYYMSGKVLFDKPKASGGRAEMEMFYASLLGETTLGKQVLADMKRISDEKDKAKVDTVNARLPEEILADEKRYNKRYTNLLSALRTAAQVRIMLEDIKERCPYVVVSWIRERMSQEQLEATHDADLSYLNVGKASNVVHSPTVLSVYTRPSVPTTHSSYGSLLADAMKKSKHISIGTFKRFKIDRAFEVATANNRNKVTYDDLVESAKKPPEKPDNNQLPSSTGGTITIAKAKRYEATNITEAFEALSGFVGYHDTHALAERTARHKFVLDNIKNSDEAKATAYAVWSILEPVFASDPSLRSQAQEWLKNMEKKTG